MHLTLYKFHCIALEQEILSKSGLLESFASSFSLHSLAWHLKHTKIMTSLIMNLLLAVSCLQSFSYEVINKSQGDFD